MRTWIAIPTFICLSLQAQRPLEIDDLFKVQRVADPQVSTKGDVAYQVGSVDMKANKITTHVWFKAMGQAPLELALGEGSQVRPRFSPDGSRLAYLAGDQVWIMDLQTKEKRQLTKLSGGADNHVWSPDGSMIAFTSATVPSGIEAENEAYLKHKDARQATGLLATTLMYRHWMDWRDRNQVSHLFVVKVDGSGTLRNLTMGWRHDIPNAAGADAGDGFVWSPDGRAIAFSSHPEFEQAISTNGEIYEVRLDGGPIRNISADNKAMDCTPRYSPDGKFLAWRAQRVPGFESDKWELWVMNRATGKIVADTRAFDRQVGDFAWQGPVLFFTAEDKAQQPLWKWEPGKAPVMLTKKRFLESFTLDPRGGKALANITDVATPPDLYDIDLATGKTTRATSHNEALAKEMSLNRGEDLWVKGAPGKDGNAPDVHALVIKPVGFDPAKKYPVAFILHGGPQGANADHWHPRWNYQSWAGRGFIVVAPNPRGSTGFGQAFTDEISGDWSGKVMVDILNTLDGFLKQCPSADPTHVIAAGGSYGGYAANWLAGHHADRFAAFVSHAGIFNTQSMQLATEELWFPHHEFSGFPWDSPATKAIWEKHSPHNASADFKKPMLVVHGMRDYRVMYTEALQIYNIHQLRGIPSELLLFPDEGHFVAKPANSKLWYETVLGWFDRWGK